MCSFANIKTIREWTAKPHRFSEAVRFVLAPYFESDEFYEQGWDLYGTLSFGPFLFFGSLPHFFVARLKTH